MLGRYDRVSLGIYESKETQGWKLTSVHRVSRGDDATERVLIFAPQQGVYDKDGLALLLTQIFLPKKDEKSV